MSDRAQVLSGVELWEYCLRRLFNLPASIVIVLGGWKTGKTDLALKIYQELKRLGIIKKAASNVESVNYSRFKKDQELGHIEDMPTLKSWTFADAISKLFIYDESISATPKRRAMSSLNVAWLKEIIPELSKGRGKLIVISQELEYTESVFYHPTFLRGVFRKINKKTAVLNSPLLKDEITFSDIPRTSVGFDPYRIALFSNDKKLDASKMTQGQIVAELYGRGVSMDEIGKRLNPVRHRYAVARILQKHLRTLKKN